MGGRTSSGGRVHESAHERTETLISALCCTSATSSSLRPRALFLVGPLHESNAQTLRSLADVDLCYEVPTFDELGPAALDSWLDRHDLTDLLHV